MRRHFFLHFQYPALPPAVGPQKRASESNPTVKVWVPPLPKIPQDTQLFEFAVLYFHQIEKILVIISSVSFSSGNSLVLSGNCFSYFVQSFYFNL